ncbi:hypothetical protein ED733_002070 [Metarhizium rileyi]|uniref:DUF7735 domain-containing protein n=1 Tax=Metarhizium rileyi (strain RCEF 4871) TaxID=1649241 RepID=A0A5C6G428_METRR|nr:hypothetical protein ED733_002070 [Metarhizium rileyi]
MNMMSIVFYLLNIAALAAATEPSVIFPTSSAPESSESEPWICASDNYINHLIGPRPTGTLSLAMESYTAELFGACTLPLEEWADCPAPDSSQLCGFSTAGPSEVLSAYSDFGSSVSSWWFGLSSAAEQITSSCPLRWSDEPDLREYVAYELEETLIFADCFIQDIMTASSDRVSMETSTPPSTAPKSSAATSAKETGATESLAARWGQDRLISCTAAVMATWMLL